MKSRYMRTSIPYFKRIEKSFLRKEKIKCKHDWLYMTQESLEKILNVTIDGWMPDFYGLRHCRFCKMIQISEVFDIGWGFRCSPAEDKYWTDMSKSKFRKSLHIKENKDKVYA